MKKLMFATALVASAAAFATNGNALNAISFEGYTVDTGVGSGAGDIPEGGGATGTAYFWFEGDTDSSLVKAFGGENVAAPSIRRPYFFQGETVGKYLELSTEGGILWRSINESSANGLGTPQAIAATGTYLDTLVQFTPTEDGGAPTLGTDDKLAIWLNVDSSGASPVTNLQVKANLYDFGEAPSATATTFTLAAATGTKEIVAGEWYRLTIKAIPNVMNTDENGIITAFEIYIDGVQMRATTAQFTSAMANMLSGMSAVSEDAAAAIAANKLFPSLAEMGGTGSTPSLEGIGFKGSGALDDIVWTTDDPFANQALEFTLTWPDGVTPVSYTIGNGEAVEIASGSTSPFSVPGLTGGETVAFTFTNADGATKTMTATAADLGGIDASTATYTWADYLGDAVGGAYEIDNLAELKLFQKGCATNATSANLPVLATVGETFKLAADIALDEAWPGIGQQNGKDVYNKPVYTNCAFRGTFDGQNHTISGFQMVGGGLDYCGFFNSTLGATISNFKIQYAGALFATDTTSSSAESGATFVGVANASTLQNLTTVAGTVSCSKGFGGIAGYTTRGTVINSCTNNVNMTSLKPNKCGGIAMITQNGSGNVPIISNCQNNGTIAGSNETGSFVGYIGNSSAVISNCESTVDYKLFHAQDATPTVAGIIKGSAAVASYTYANSHTVSGLDFATVEGNVATFVTDNALALNGEYKVMSAGATATFAFAEAGTIAFDTALFTPTYAITAAEGLTLTDETVGTVKTYTAAGGGAQYQVTDGNTVIPITPKPEDFDAIQPFLPEGVETNNVPAVNALLALPIEGTGTPGIPVWQALFLGVEPTTNGLEQVAIKSISFNAEGKIEVEMADAVTLKTERGVDIKLKLMGSTDLTNANGWTQIGSDITNTKEIPAITPAQGETKKFYKVVVEFSASSN